MEEMEGFKRQFEELIKGIENIDEVGCLELTRIEKELNSLKSRAGISANSFAHDTENDITDIRDVLNVWNELDDRIIEETMKVDLKHQSRWELAQAKYAEYKRISEYRRENQKRINEYKFELDKHKALLNHISDPFAKDNMEDTIKDDEKHIQKAEDLNARYDKELHDYSVIIRTLLEGGKLPELDRIDEEEMLEEINRNHKVEEEKPAKKVKKIKEIEEEDEEKKVKEPTPKKVSVVREEDEETEEEDENINLIFPVVHDEDENKVVKPPVFGNSDEPEEEEEEDEDKTKADPSFVAMIGKAAEEEDENKKVLPPSFEEAVKKAEEEEEDEEDEEIDETLDEEEEAVEAKVKPPKDSLWKKVGKAVAGAIGFLSMVATAIHTGMILHRTADKNNLNPSKEATVETTESETEEVKEDKTSKAEETNKAAEVTPATAKTDEKKTEPKKEEPKKEEPKQEEVVEEKLDIKLNPGETVFNTETGVEVGYNGNAAHVDSNGAVHQETSRTLEHNENDQAIVTKNDLNREVKNEVPVTGANDRTGYEVSEEEAKAKMTEEEKAVATSQEDEWFKWLEESGLSR